MNPYFQDNWNDVHTALIGFIRESLAETLPPDLNARAEEHVTLSGDEGDTRFYRADVSVIELWRAGFPPVLNLGNTGDGDSSVSVAEPLLFSLERVPERWIEIRNARGKPVTIIEVISPANKRSDGRADYRKRQRHFLDAGINLVEIDLIRAGLHAVSVGEKRLKFPQGTTHLVCVTRTIDDQFARHEVYFCPLRDPLPVVRVPLRTGESDAILSLQPLIDRCYRTGRYWLSARSSSPLDPPAADDDEAAWIAERMRAAGL